jgi:predicted nucleic acid-binding protein
MAERIVINTGPLITLACIEALDVPGQLACEFICPEEARAELEAGVVAGHPIVNSSWLQVCPLQGPLSCMLLSALDAGEAAVILLALEQRIPLVCIDGWKGRRMALATGLKVTGALGLLGGRYRGLSPL